MATDADRIAAGFGQLGQGIGSFRNRQREEEKERLGRAEKLHQELRPLPPEQANIYQQLSSSGMGLPDIQREFIERRKAGEDPKAIAIDFKLRMQGRAQGPAAPGQNMFLGSPQQETPEPYPMGQGQHINQMGGPATTSLQRPPRPPTMQDVSSLGALSQIAARQQQGGSDDLRLQELELARERLGETRLSRALRDRLGSGNLGYRGAEFNRRENLDYAKMAGELPTALAGIDSILASLPPGIPAGNYVADRVAEAMGGRIEGFMKLANQASLTPEQRTFKRRVQLYFQGYRKTNWGATLTGNEMRLADALSGDQLSYEDTVAALAYLRQYMASSLGRVQATVPGAAQRIEAGATAINRGGGPTVAPLAPLRGGGQSSLPSSSGPPSPGWVRQRNKTTGQERWFNPTTGESR